MVFTNFSIEHWMCLVSCSIGALCVMLRAPYIYLFYFVLNAIYFGYRVPFQILNYPGGFQGSALYSLGFMLIIPLAAEKISKLPKRYLEWGLFVLGLTAYSKTLYLQPSFAYCVGAICVGALSVLDSILAYALAVLLLPTLALHGTTSKLMFGFIFSAWMSERLRISVIFLGSAALLWFLPHSPDPFLGGSERIRQWNQAIGYFISGGSPTVFRYLFGFGSGSYLLLGGAIQDFKGEFFSFMHNDVLQILFEYGFVGFAMLHSFIAKLIFVDAKNPRQVALIVSGYVFMMFYFPLHFSLSAVALTISAFLVMRKDAQVFEG